MIHIFDPLRELTQFAIIARMTLAFICGGVIGIEREFKRRPAGFRTHILVCLGAAVTTLTGQYLVVVMQYHTDLSRLGAQVIAGIGFVGAGTIIVTKHQRVKGLTTAAGLWASAIVGLTMGAGFYEAGLFTTALILIAELVFSKIENKIYSKTPEVNFFLEYKDKSYLDIILNLFHERNVKILHLEITRESGEKYGACAIFSLRLPKTYTADDLINQVNQLDGIVSIEEL